MVCRLISEPYLYRTHVGNIAMKITSIKQQVKNPERASIFVEGKYSFSLSLNELVAEKLKMGQDLTEPEQKRLKKLSEEGKLRARVLEWLLNRPRSSRELREYLYRKKVESDLAQSLSDEMAIKGYLDDERFAEWLVELRRRGGKSERAIRAELGRKGIDRELADAALVEGRDEADRLRALVDKKQKLARYRADPQKLIAYLARQGFSYDDIKRTLADS